MNMNNSLTLPSSNTLKKNARLWAEYYNGIIEPGHGLFFDFKAAPELEEPALNFLIKKYGWKLEKPFFIRKPRA